VATLIAPTPPLQLRRKQTKIFFFFLKNMEGAKQMKKIVKKNFWFVVMMTDLR